MAAFWIASGLLCVATPSLAGSTGAYALDTDVVYGEGVVTIAGKPSPRDLLLDVYTPTAPDDGARRPGVVLVHGGAFHRGGRRQPPYREAGAVHSPMEDYARLLAARGYAAFVVEYRLAPENPIPRVRHSREIHLALDDVITDAGLLRTNFARRLMGLSPLDRNDKILLWNAAMSAAEDVRRAVAFVRGNADTYRVDPSRIALGGHSAGGGTTINVALGLGAPVAAIFPLSPAGVLFDLQRTSNTTPIPPTLLLVSQNDEPAVLEGIPELVRLLREMGAPIELAWVPGFPHFYPTGAVSLGDDGTRTSVGERVADFLDLHLGAESDG